VRLEPHEKAGSNPARRHQFVLIPVLLQHVERLLPKRPNVAIGSIVALLHAMPRRGSLALLLGESRRAA